MGKLEYIHTLLKSRKLTNYVHTLLRGVSTLLRTGLNIIDVIVELNSPRAVGMAVSLNNRSQFEALKHSKQCKNSS